MKSGNEGGPKAGVLWQRRAWLAQALLLAAPCARAAPPVVPLALSDGLNQKFADALLRELAEGAGVRWQVSRVPFSRVLRMTEAGEALGFGVSPSRERDAQLVFSEAVFRSGVWAVGRAEGDAPITSIASLKGRKVCASRQARLGAELDMAAGRDFTVHAVPGDLGSRLRMLEAGRCDVLLVTHFNEPRQARHRPTPAEGAAGLHRGPPGFAPGGPRAGPESGPRGSSGRHRAPRAGRALNRPQPAAWPQDSSVQPLAASNGRLQVPAWG
jgi:Bacterial extracellular solute-binding proteins, family 3